MSASSFLRNGNKAHHYITTIWKRPTISNSFGAPVTRPVFQNQPKYWYSKFPEKKVKSVDFSIPFAAKGVVTRFSWISNNGFVGWYLGMIKNRPVLTKSVTCSLIYIAADLSSQV